jgi:hypothetical protein
MTQFECIARDIRQLTSGKPEEIHAFASIMINNHKPPYPIPNITALRDIPVAKTQIKHQLVENGRYFVDPELTVKRRGG